MEKKIKVIILVLVVLLATSLFIIFNIQDSRLKLLREYKDTKQRLTQEKEEITKKLNVASAGNKDFQEKLKFIQGKLESISKEKEELQRKNSLANKEKKELLRRLDSYPKLQEQLASLEKENKSLKKQVEALRTLEADYNKIKQENEEFKQKLEKAENFLKEKTYLFVDVKQKEPEVIEEPKVRSVELPPIVVSPFSASSEVNSPFTLEGEVLNVNREYTFVVIDLGEDHGVKEGMIFDVLRENRPLGKIEVIQTRRGIAACDIIQSETFLKSGDKIRY